MQRHQAHRWNAAHFCGIQQGSRKNSTRQDKLCVVVSQTFSGPDAKVRSQMSRLLDKLQKRKIRISREIEHRIDVLKHIEGPDLIFEFIPTDLSVRRGRQ